MYIIMFNKIHINRMFILSINCTFYNLNVLFILVAGKKKLSFRFLVLFMEADNGQLNTEQSNVITTEYILLKFKFC